MSPVVPFRSNPTAIAINGLEGLHADPFCVRRRCGRQLRPAGGKVLVGCELQAELVLHVFPQVSEFLRHISDTNDFYGRRMDDAEPTGMMVFLRW